MFNRRLRSAAFAALLALLSPFAFGAAPTVTLTANPASGVSPLSVTLTWSSTGATTCTASGGWTGAKATSGTATVTATASVTYSLSCTAPNGSAAVSWTNPTQRADGTAASLTGNAIYRASTAAGVATAPALATTPAPATSYTDSNLATGTYFYAVTAKDANGLESGQSAVASKAVTQLSGSASAPVTVASPPLPPTNISVIETTAYSVNKSTDNLNLVSVGTVPLATACNQNQDANGYHVVPRSKVTWTGPARPLVVVAKCG